MTFDMKNFLRSVSRNAKPVRIPKERGLLLASTDFAGVFVRDTDPDYFQRNKRVADWLQKVGSVYYGGADLEATKPKTRSRPKHIADIAFIYGMACLWEREVGPVGFRSYKNPPAKSEHRGGKEIPNSFQRVCQSWMRLVDPERQKPLQANAFRKAGIEFRKRGHSAKASKRKTDRSN